MGLTTGCGAWLAVPPIYNWVSRCPRTGNIELHSEFTAGSVPRRRMNGNVASALQLR